MNISEPKLRSEKFDNIVVIIIIIIIIIIKISMTRNVCSRDAGM